MSVTGVLFGIADIAFCEMIGKDVIATEHVMSIGKRVSETFIKLIAGDPEGAMFQICAAVEATAKRESGKAKGTRSDYKAFLLANTDIICGVGLGEPICGLRISYTHPEIDRDAAGTCSLEDIIYHAVRCGLYHSASLPANIRFTKKVIGSSGGQLKMPETMVAGLAFAVVVSPANSGEVSNSSHFAKIRGEVFHVNKWWGRVTDFRKAMYTKLSRASIP